MKSLILRYFLASFFFLFTFINLSIGQVTPTERAALEALYDATDGDNWTINTNWKTGVADDWYGVTVFGGRVVGLQLPANNLTGPLPTEIGDLDQLVFLFLSENQISGPIPISIGGLQNLTVLSIDNNDLTGDIPSEIGSIGTLTDIALHTNGLTGSIPASFSNLDALEVLSLYENNLTGTVPSFLGTLNNLRELLLGDNFFDGSIPVSLQNLTSLESLWLYGNDLTGTIPSEFENLFALRELLLNRNQLSGTIPAELGNIPGLLSLLLSDNLLSGNIPPELTGLSNARVLDFGNNSLTGPIPSGFESQTLLTDLLFYDNPGLSGAIPESFATNLVNLNSLDLFNTNICEPTSGTYTTWASGLSFYLSSGIGCGAEINITQSSSDIPNGGTFDFGDVTIATNSDLSFVIENTGTDPLTLISVDVTGADFSLQTSPPGSVAAGSSTTITVRFSPTTTGSKTGSFVIVSDDADESTYSITLNGNGTAPAEPEIEVTVGAVPFANGSTYDFGSVQIGNSVNVTFTINNSGTSDLNVSAIAIPIGDFSVSGFTPGDVGSGSSTTFTATFSPTSLGGLSATISISNTDSNEDPYDILLTGTGTAAPVPEIRVTQSVTEIPSGGSYDYGTVQVNSTTDIVFLVDNLGTATLNLTGFNLPGSDFTLLPTPPTSVNSGGSETFTVQFNPTTTGSKSGTLTITNDDPDESSYIVNFTGESVSPEIDIIQGITPIANGGSFDFGNVQELTNSDVVFTIENTGSSLLSISNVSATGSDFSIQGATPTSIAPGGSENVTVRFTPADASAKTGQLIVENDDLDESTYSITLNGTGTPTPVPEINIRQGVTNIPSSGSYDYGNVQELTNSDITFTIENTGTAVLNISLISTVGSDFNIQGAAPASVDVGGTETFTVRFSPSGTGATSGSIIINNNDSDENPYTILLSGTGTPTPVPEINVQINALNVASGGSFDFGSLLSGTTLDRIVEIENTGTTTLNISSIDLTGSVFSIVGVTPTTVAAGGSETFTLRFAPDAASPFSGSITVNNNDSDEGTYFITLNGTGLVNPDIEVLENTTNYPNGSTYDFGLVEVSNNSDITITLSNTGFTELSIASVIISGTGFSITSTTPTSIPSGSSEDIVVRFNPNAETTFSGDITISSNDPDESTFVLNLSGEGSLTPVPEINVKQNSTSVSSGSSRFLGFVVEGSSDTYDFEIENLGTATLNINNISVTGSDFTLITPLPTSVATSTSSIFTVSFSPSTAGIKSGVISIDNDDSNESPYTINISAEATALPASEISIVNGGTSLPSGSTLDFGPTNIGLLVSNNITIRNDGSSTLTVSSITINGDDYSFDVSETLPYSIPAGEEITLNINFAPTLEGPITGSIAITNDDSDEGDYSITLVGEGVLPPVPEIEVETSTASISINDEFDYGQALEFEEKTASFVIKNSGNTILNLSSIEVIGEDFELIGNIPSTVQVGDSVTVTVKFTPSSVGLKTGTITITNNDVDESEFTINLRGEGVRISTPVAKDLSSSTVVGQSVSLDVISESTFDITTQTVTTSIVTNPNIGTAMVNADQTISYNADSTNYGLDSFEYQICDQFNQCDIASISIESTNSAPNISLDLVELEPGGVEVLELTPLIEDPEGLGIISVIAKDVRDNVSIEADLSLTRLRIDYSQSSFSGMDSFTLEACDLSNDCSEKVVTVSVAEPTGVVVYNAVSPNGDGKHEFLKLENLEFFAENKVVILDRRGKEVWEINDYSNQEINRAFIGQSGNGAELPNGTYYYIINLKSPTNLNYIQKGFLVLQR